MKVRIALGIRVVSLRGTLRVHIKPPPSDQIWFGFTTMPDVDFYLESSVGERKINSGQVALFLNNRFKAAIREIMVLPNSESIAIPSILAEKVDWVPQEVAPFIWVSDQNVTREVPTPQHGEPTCMPEPSRVPVTNNPKEKDNSKRTKPESVHQLTRESSDACALSSAPMNNTTPNKSPLQEQRTPLLACDEPEESCQPMKEGPMYKSPSLPLIMTESHNQTVVEGDNKVPKKMEAKARMLSLKKRVGDKLENKRRHLEVRSKSMVERMRG